MAALSESPSTTVHVIAPQGGWSLPDLREVRDSGDILRMLVRRDVAVRYRQTAVGILWAVIQPLALAVVFGVFLGSLAKVPSQTGVPYPLYVFSGMVLWTYFSQAFTRASDSTIESANLISKVYFPRIVIPTAAVVTPLFDLFAALVILIVALFIYGEPPGPEILLLPVVVALAVGSALGLGLWLSAVNVRYRDVKHLVPFLILVGLFVTPVTYPLQIVPEDVRWLYALNPLVGVLELYRYALFGAITEWWVPLVPLVTTVVLLLSGAIFFNRAQRGFADLL